jgi:hypothetical protein
MSSAINKVTISTKEGLVKITKKGFRRAVEGIINNAIPEHLAGANFAAQEIADLVWDLIAPEDGISNEPSAADLKERADKYARKSFKNMEYLNDLLTIKKMFGDHSYASHLEIFIKNFFE